MNRPNYIVRVGEAIDALLWVMWLIGSTVVNLI